MPYTPRKARDILRSLVARFVARSPANDVSEGSVLLHLFGSVAEEMNGVELRLARIRDSFFLDDADGSDLDERVAELPGAMVPRLPAVAAAGNVMRLTRDTEVGVLAVPAGATFGRLDDSAILYRTPVAVQFENGQDTITGVRVVCMTPGSVGNCAGGAISRIVNAPSSVRSAINDSPLTNGLPVETDAQLRHRARAYLSSLARCQPKALEYAALSFMASDRTRLKFVRLFEDVERPGYSELVIDDGSGLSGIVRDGAAVTGAVPASGVSVLYHEAPATAPIAQFTITRAGADIVVPMADGVYLSIPERGLVYILDPTLLQAGDTWKISGYKVYTGIAAELQAKVEGDNSNPNGEPGWRAAGTRVRAVPPLTQPVGLDLHITPLTGVDLDALVDVVLDNMVEYVGALGPGEPLFVARIIDRVMDNPSVLNVRVYQGGSDPPVPAVDIYPATARHVIRTSRPLLSVIAAPEV